jgi:diguanylate cyclase (GGDEF)-like protein/PAS domain S-box-containing protein/hemerythrin-like metal-binding protein
MKNEQKEFLAIIFENTLDAVLLMDSKDVITGWNKQAELIFGWSRDEAVGRLMHETIIPERFRKQHIQGMQHFLSTGEGPVLNTRIEIFALHRDGYEFPVELAISPIKTADGYEFSSFVRDISERKRVENALRESEERFRQMFERHSAVMLLIDPQSGIIIDANPAAANFFNFPLTYLRGKTISNINIQSESEISNEIQQAIIEQRNYFVFNHRLANDEIRTVEVHSSPVSFKNKNLLFAIIHDITDRKLAEEQIRYLAFYDSLTKIPNRRLLNDRLDLTIIANKRSSRYGALMFLDLDNFKPLNDSHGHKVGDLLLIEAARRIGSCIRETDTVARFGGDEFVVMLSEIKEDQSESTVQAGIVAEKIRTLMSEPYRLVAKQDDGAEIIVEHQCTSSIGVVVFDHQANREDILKRADTAMYEAKKAGRNCVVFNKQGSSKTSIENKDSNILHLIWHDSYACGEPIIDDEHRKLFELANNLIDSAFSRNENPQQFDSALDILLAHVVKHFADEEVILAQHHYNDLDVHAHDHKALIENALKLRDSALAVGVTIGGLVNFLAEEVVAQHLLKTDRKFFPLFTKNK